jgi:hypothetical protein
MDTCFYMLLMGERGVTKSTFINAFCNYLKYNTLEVQNYTNNISYLIPISALLIRTSNKSMSDSRKTWTSRQLPDSQPLRAANASNSLDATFWSHLSIRHELETRIESMPTTRIWKTISHLWVNLMKFIRFVYFLS